MHSASGIALNLRRGQVAPLSGRTTNTQNPAFHLRDDLFLWCQVWMQETRKGPVSISLGKPGRDGEGIMLIAGAVSAGVGIIAIPGTLRLSRTWRSPNAVGILVTP